MSSFVTWRRVGLATTDVSEECITPIFSVEMSMSEGNRSESQHIFHVTTKENVLVKHSLLCKILSFHGSDYGEFRLLGCDAL
jgi:hypothetical protein